MLDLLITGGHVIDTARGIDGIMPVGVRDGRIVPAAGDDAAKERVDATGCYVTPGLIDAHAHLFPHGSGLGVQPDLLLATGVTAAIDAGTAGCANYEAFRLTDILPSKLRIKSLLGYNSSGQIELGYQENYSRKLVNLPKLKELFAKYPGELLGLKLRFQREVVGDDGLHYLEEMIQVAGELGCGVTVHTTNPPEHGAVIAERLRPGDVYCHVYQGGGEHSILDEDGRVHPAVWKARERGVLFDAANGTGNFAFSTAVQALKDGFLPDLIGADNATNSFGKGLYAKNLPFVLSKYLMLGIELRDILRCVTENAARLMGMEGEIGTLAEGALADIAVLRLTDRREVFWDSRKAPDTARQGGQMLVPLMTVLGGEIVFRSNEL